MDGEFGQWEVIFKYRFILYSLYYLVLYWTCIFALFLSYQSISTKLDVRSFIPSSLWSSCLCICIFSNWSIFLIDFCFVCHCLVIWSDSFYSIWFDLCRVFKTISYQYKRSWLILSFWYLEYFLWLSYIYYGWTTLLEMAFPYRRKIYECHYSKVEYWVYNNWYE